jgi:hypothetical protein
LIKKGLSQMRQTLDNVVPPRRFERLTYGLGIRKSALLSCFIFAYIFPH